MVRRVAAGPGASTSYDWEGMTVALMLRIHGDGLPATQPSRPPEARSVPVHHCQDPRKRFGLHAHRHGDPAPVRRGYLNLRARRRTGID